MERLLIGRGHGDSRFLARCSLPRGTRRRRPNFYFREQSRKRSAGTDDAVPEYQHYLTPPPNRLLPRTAPKKPSEKPAKQHEIA